MPQQPPRRRISQRPCSLSLKLVTNESPTTVGALGQCGGQGTKYSKRPSRCFLGPFGGQGPKMLKMSPLGSSWGHSVARHEKAQNEISRCFPWPQGGRPQQLKSPTTRHASNDLARCFEVDDKWGSYCKWSAHDKRRVQLHDMLQMTLLAFFDVDRT